MTIASATSCHGAQLLTSCRLCFASRRMSSSPNVDCSCARRSVTRARSRLATHSLLMLTAMATLQNVIGAGLRIDGADTTAWRPCRHARRSPIPPPSRAPTPRHRPRVAAPRPRVNTRPGSMLRGGLRRDQVADRDTDLGRDAEIKPGRSDRDPSPCPTHPQSHAQTPVARHHTRRLPRWLGAGSSNRR